MSATLLQATLICSGINDKSILNVNSDHVEEGFLLVTFQNMVKRYCLSLRKQVNSWSTKSWNPFTSTAIRDPHSQKIVVVVSDSSIYQWPLDEEIIENVDKQKFKTKIKDIILNEKIFIVFITGYVESLEHALESRKEEKPQLIDRDEEIVKKQVNIKQNIFILLLRNTLSKNLSVCIGQIESGNFPQICNFSHHIYSLIGSCIFSSGTLLTAWSDGNLYSFDCLEIKSGLTSPGFQQGQLSCLKRTGKANLFPISSDLVAIQGRNINEEGGIIILWDTKFGVNVSQKDFKMFRDSPYGWPIKDGMVFVQGSSLCHLPISIKPSTVASMFGSKALENSSTSEICCGWSSGKEDEDLEAGMTGVLNTIYSNKSSGVCAAIRKLPSDSLTEDIITIQVVKFLIESKDTKTLNNCLDDFKFIPEGSLVSILKYFSELSDSELSKCLEEDDDIMQVSIVDDDDSETKKFYSPYTEQRRDLVNKILVKPFSINRMESHIRFLDFSTCWNLIEHLYYLLVSEKAEMIPSSPEMPSMDVACEWMSLLLDAKYHQLVMTSEVEVHKKLLECLNYVASLKSYLLLGDEIEPLVDRVLHSRPIPTLQDNLPYSIERLC